MVLNSCLRTCSIFLVVCTGSALSGVQAGASTPVQSSLSEPQPSTDKREAGHEQELRTGTALTGHGEFERAIPHLLAARGHVVNEYAAGVNLAICYIATNQPNFAITILNDLRSAGTDNADVNNLLAQAYIANGENQQALQAFKRAASSTPDNEKLYTFVADACMGKRAYALGVDIVNMGMLHLPNSARLHFERAMFLSLLDRFDEAKSDFTLARKLEPGSNIAFDAAAQEAMLEGNIPETIRVGREGVKRGDADFMLLTLLGEALLQSGAAPGQPEFDEAKAALEKSISLRANYPSSQLALGKLYLLDNRLDDAIIHLELARELDPENASVYSNLASAYRKHGDTQKAQDALAILTKMNKARAEQIRTTPGDRKASYDASGGASTK